MNIQEEIKALGLMELVSGENFNGYQYISDETMAKLANLIAIKEIDARIDEDRRARSVELAGGIKVIGHEKSLDYCVTMLDRIKDLEQQLLKLRDGN